VIDVQNVRVEDEALFLASCNVQVQALWNKLEQKATKKGKTKNN